MSNTAKVTGGRIPGSSERLCDSKVTQEGANLEVHKPLVFHLTIHKFAAEKGDGELSFLQVKDGRMKQVKVFIEWYKEDENVIRVDCMEYLEMWLQIVLA